MASRRWFELRIQPVPAGICVYSSDIDDRKRRENSGTSHTGIFSRASAFILRMLGR